MRQSETIILFLPNGKDSTEFYNQERRREY